MVLENPTEAVQAYRARWILPIGSDPIENGVIEIIDGRISSLHDRHDSRVVDLGNAAIVPGLVNAHVHLEFSDLTRPLGPPAPFTEWIRALVRHRRSRPNSAEELSSRGAIECLQSGTTLLADIVTDESSLSGLVQNEPAVVALREIIGLLPEQIESQLDVATRFLNGIDQRSPVACRGLSPHAPYSVHPELYHRLIELAARHGSTAAVHLAETRAELELLDRGTGPFVEMLKGFGVWCDGAIAKGSRPKDYLEPLAALDRALVVHGNYLDFEELEFIAANPNLCVVYCPRTHAYFGHDDHPWQKILAIGGHVAIGTDSRASNPDLNLWRELCFLHEHFPGVDPSMLLKLGSADGARALGFDPRDWSLRVGQAANLAVVGLENTNQSVLYDAVLDNHCSIIRTMHDGRWMT